MVEKIDVEIPEYVMENLSNVIVSIQTYGLLPPA